MSMNRLVLGSLSPALAPLARDAPGHTLCSALPPACLPWQGLWGGGKESVPPWRTEIFQLEDLAGWPSWIPLAPPGRRERGTDARARGRARSPSPRGRAVPEDARSPSLPPGWAPRSLRASPGFCCWEVSGEPGSAERGVGRRVTGLGPGLYRRSKPQPGSPGAGRRSIIVTNTWDESSSKEERWFWLMGSVHLLLALLLWKLCTSRWSTCWGLFSSGQQARSQEGGWRGRIREGG
jgi:hypothetical protein